jgi:hypothetical protein
MPRRVITHAAAMKTPAPIHIFRSGTHTDVSGKTLAFGETELEASAKAYDPALFEAPLVVGHPQLDAPAYGWVESLSFSQNGLSAAPRQVDPAFAELVRAGRYKKISASFYLPNSPANPVPGVFYLRHVGFLGAAAPAVKGLKPVAFAQAEEGVVEFSDAWAERQNASLWRALREWLLAKFGQEEADKAVAPWLVESVEDAARKELLEDQAQPEFAEGGPANPNFKEDEVEKEKEALAAERAKLAEERAALERQRADFAEREAKLMETEAGRIHAEHVTFAEILVKEGKLLPANKEATVGLLDSLAVSSAVVAFAEENGGKVEKSALQTMKDMLTTSPKLVDFSERAVGDLDAGGSASFAAPQGYTADPERLELHGKAVAFQAAHPGTDYATALVAVGGN